VVARAYTKAKASGKTHGVTPQERDGFLWLMHEFRGVDGIWTVLFRGQSIDCDAEMALKLQSWGGTLVFRTYRPRGG
jgi:hypothetical protein